MIAVQETTIFGVSNLPFRFIDLLKKVKHEKDNGDNFTEQAQTIRFTTVPGWVFNSRAIDECIW